MRYEQPTINALESARVLVQGSPNGKLGGVCRDGGAPNPSSRGAYELDE